MFNTTADAYQDIRDAVRDLCQQFPSEYFRKVDEERSYPEAFVDALTHAGWLAALIPQEYGGSGLGLTEASVIMEEIRSRRSQPTSFSLTSPSIFLGCRVRSEKTSTYIWIAACSACSCIIPILMQY